MTIAITETPIQISERAAHQIQQGQLWVFSNELSAKPDKSLRGAWCHFAHRGQVVATGYFNPHSLIAGRVVGLGKVDDVESLLWQNLRRAFERRRDAVKSGSARLVFSEADFLPGFVIDWYGSPSSSVAVIQSNTAGADAALSAIEKILPDVFSGVFGRPLSAIVTRADAAIRSLEGVENFVRVVVGNENELKSGVFSSDGVLYAADFVSGQKTGFFLDQRDNRAFFVENIRKKPGLKVLDLFSYSGGWGLAALKAGAAHVTFVDQSEEALVEVARGLELNGLTSASGKRVCEDVFDFLEKNQETFDVVVCDPPAFAKSKKALPQAKRAYEKLNRLAFKFLKQDGLLMTCSCSYHLSPSDFMELIQSAVAKSNALAHVVYNGGQSQDHPVLISMPETRYLKCVGLRKL